MSNKLIRKYPVPFGTYGILETSCFPASYYAGFIWHAREGWTPYENLTSRWHRTLELAIAAAKKELKALSKQEA